MKDSFHPSLALQGDRPLIYTAFSKHLFYFRMFISKFVLEKGGVPLNPFMVFDYFLLDSVDRNVVRESNNNLVKKCEELWVFGTMSDGVQAEIQQAKALKKSLRYFTVENQIITECSEQELGFEE